MPKDWPSSATWPQRMLLTEALMLRCSSVLLGEATFQKYSAGGAGDEEEADGEDGEQDAEGEDGEEGAALSRGIREVLN